MKIGLGINTGGPIDKVIGRFRDAEAAGLATAWLSNAFGYDALTVAAVAGQVTSRIEIGTFVVPTYPRHPGALAQQALSTSAATSGRLALGIGLSHQRVIEGMYGLDFSKPVRHMREYLAILVPALKGERVEFSGEEFKAALQLAIPDAPAPSVLVAALGPQMLKVAGRAADGTAVWMGGPRYFDQAVPIISAAAAEAGRPAPRVVAGIPIAITSQPDAARESAARAFALYNTLPSYRAVLDREGAAGPADVAIIGDEATARRALEGLRDAGVTDFHASPFRVDADPDARARTEAFLGSIAPELA